MLSKSLLAYTYDLKIYELDPCVLFQGSWSTITFKGDE